MGFKNVPNAALPQLYSDFMHLAAAITVVVIAGILAYAGKISADISGAVFTGVIGYIAGQARTVPRTVPTRLGDNNTKEDSLNQ